MSIFKKLGKFFKKVGSFFKGIFTSMETAWNKLEPAVQEALKLGSSVVDFINTNLKLVPEELIAGLLKNHGLSKEELEEMLAKVKGELNLLGDIPNPTLLQTVEAIQKYLDGKEGKDWAQASDSIAKILAMFKAPKETRSSVIIQFMVFVYQNFIKKD